MTVTVTVTATATPLKPGARAGRAAIAVFVVGLLFVWLIRPIGNACPDVDKLPSGSDGSSTPSFAPPFTRTCTYTTPEGTNARKRYVPVLDLLVLLLATAVVGGAVGLAGGGRGGDRHPRAAAPARPPKRRREHAPPAALADEQAESESESERDAAERARARQERQARRRG